MRKNFGAKTWLYPMPVLIVGTYDENDAPNAMNAAWGGIYDTNQIMICLADDHKTTENIKKTGAFTVSFATADKLVSCDYVGIISANDVPDKFARAGFHAVKSEYVNAPVIKELPMTVECKLLKFNEDGICVGKIVNVSADERVLDENGKVDIKKLDPVIYDSATHAYWSFGEKVGRAFSDGKSIQAVYKNTDEAGKTILETRRLLLRPWREEDAEKLYEYAKDPEVGPAAGWPPHTSVENSREIIRDVLSEPEVYAVCLKDGTPIGSIGLHLKGETQKTDRSDECELGYWLGKPFWGQGLIPEAARALLSRAFEELGMRSVRCRHYDGNVKSRRVQEKLGFVCYHIAEGVEVPLLHETRTEHILLLTKEEWLKTER